MKGLAMLIIAIGITASARASHYYIGKGDVNALKAAITASNTNNAPDTIHLYPYSIYNLNTVDNVFVFESYALPVILLDNYNSANKLTIFGNGAQLVLDTAALDNVKILNLAGTVDI
ncbi:MAG: hypothetical protein QM734_04410 [Cyclobacteriaceae bacterium]